MKTTPFKILTLTVLSLISVAAGAQSFRNPVIGRSWPDPTVWSNGTRYYTISTGVGTIMTSEDLVNWTDLKKAPLSAEASEAAKAVGRKFWAPDVVKIKDRWMLYLTCYESAENCGISVFESESATGPWEFVGKLTHSKDNGIKDSIDPEVVMDPESGKVWMFFGSIGGIHRGGLTSDGKRLADGARFEHVAGLNINLNPSRSRVYEGAYLYNKDGYWYLFASSGKYYNHTYGIVVGRSRSLDGIFRDKKGKKMYWTLELATKLEDAPWPATKEELIDYATRTGLPLEVIENLQEIEDEGDVYETIEDIWPDYPSKEDFLFNEDEY